MNYIKNKTLRWVCFAILATFLIFIGFHILYSADITEYGKEFIAGCLGALITIAATALLLKSQTDNEITKDQLSGIFQTKLALYNEFLVFINGIIKDGDITSKELNEMVHWGLKLALVANAYVIRCVYWYSAQLILLGSDCVEVLDDEDNYEKFRKWISIQLELTQEEMADRETVLYGHITLGDIVSALRDDLGSKKLSSEDENIDLQVVLNSLLELLHVDGIETEGGNILLVKNMPEKKPGSRAKLKREMQ